MVPRWKARRTAPAFGPLSFDPGKSYQFDLSLKRLLTESGWYPAEKCGARLYVDAVGMAPVLESFSRLAPRNGSLARVGVHKAPVAIDLAAVAFNNWHIHGCSDGATEEMWPDILDMMRLAGHA